MKIAIEGCAHGELDIIYETLQETERIENIKIDLLLCCGDFQAVRNEYDLRQIAIKPKYLSMNSFHKYYSGQKVAPYLTIFIGGNHEASNHLKELPNGGWVCPNIYYLGNSGVVNFGGLRIAGLSGIYKAYHYKKGYFEKVPLSDEDMRSAYHIRELEVYKLMQLTGNIDIFLSHDWPKGIIAFGDRNKLFRVKKFLAAEADTLGSPPSWRLLTMLQPRYWFSAHMHVKFPAIVPHQGGNITKFLALDKVIPGRDFIQVLDFPEAQGPKQLIHDPEWLAIVLSTLHIADTYIENFDCSLPSLRTNPSTEEVENIEKRAGEVGLTGPESVLLPVPQNFVRSAPIYNPQNRNTIDPNILAIKNPQTKAFVDLLGSLDPSLNKAAGSTNPEEKTFPEQDEDTPQNTTTTTTTYVKNPEEVDLDDL